MLCRAGEDKKRLTLAFSFIHSHRAEGEIEDEVSRKIDEENNGYYS